VVKTHTGKTSSLGQSAASLTSSPLEGPPRQVSVSHEKSGPGWHVGPDAQRERHHRRAWGNGSPCKRLAPTRAFMLV
jgi:hypothetical protein